MMAALLASPSTEPSHRCAAAGVLLLLSASALALLAAPGLMPEDYSWIENTTSESAAQRVDGAWLARLGFLAFGLAVLWLAAACRCRWARGATWLHAAFGVLMIAAAVFCHRPWEVGAVFDPVEDSLHSVAATAMGLAFACGVLVRLLQRQRQQERCRLLDVCALLAATILPLLMALLPALEGLLQRSMFLIAYLWYASEAIGLQHQPPRGATTAASN